MVSPFVAASARQPSFRAAQARWFEAGPWQASQPTLISDQAVA
jgi:hypothetical protein